MKIKKKPTEKNYTYEKKSLYSYDDKNKKNESKKIMIMYLICRWKTTIKVKKWTKKWKKNLRNRYENPQN